MLMLICFCVGLALIFLYYYWRMKGRQTIGFIVFDPVEFAKLIKSRGPHQALRDYIGGVYQKRLETGVFYEGESKDSPGSFLFHFLELHGIELISWLSNNSFNDLALGLINYEVPADNVLKLAVSRGDEKTVKLVLKCRISVETLASLVLDLKKLLPVSKGLFDLLLNKMKELSPERAEALETGSLSDIKRQIIPENRDIKKDGVAD